jgi:CoA:oxalate CoA-transferase
MTGRDTERPLAGVRVLDLSRMVSGPLCTRILADLGADVIKVEGPSGDMTRYVGPQVEGIGAYFAQMNAGKRNLALDFRSPATRNVLHRLLAECDVLVENFRTGVLETLLDSPQDLRSNFPDLVVCSITGWGQHGPWSTRPAYAPYVHAEIGMLDMTARMRGSAPLPEVHQYADVLAALMASNAITTALFRRARGGGGTHIDLNMAKAAVYADEWAAVELMRYDGPLKPFDSWSFLVTALGDGTPVSLMGDPVDAFPLWAELVAPDDGSRVLSDPRLATADARAAHRHELQIAVDDLFRRVPNEQAFNTLLALNPLLGARIQPLADLAESPWATETDLTAHVAPGVRVPKAPWTEDKSSIGVRSGAVQRGAHNSEILTGWLGIDSDTLSSTAKMD